MALFHLSVTQVKRSEGQSAIASAAYRAGERLYSERYGEYSDYTRKGGVICSDILLPPQAPPEYQDRATLWNAVEQVEKHKKAQLAYSFDIALQNELSMEENIALAREFVQRYLVGRGMIADLAVCLFLEVKSLHYPLIVYFPCIINSTALRIFTLKETTIISLCLLHSRTNHLCGRLSLLAPNMTILLDFQLFSGKLTTKMPVVHFEVPVAVFILKQA